VIAPFGYSVRKSPEELAKEQNDIARSVEPIFTFDSAALDSSRALVDQFASELARLASSPEGQRITGVQLLGAKLGVQLTPAEAQYLAIPGRGEAVPDAVARAYDRWLATGIAAGGALDGIQGAVTLRQDTSVTSVNADSISAFPTLLARARLLQSRPAVPGWRCRVPQAPDGVLPADDRVRPRGHGAGAPGPAKVGA
jgi:hypothetical protein